MFKTIENRKIRIAVLGCGRVAKNHFAAIEENSQNLELVAICESQPAELKIHEKLHQVPSYLCLDEMLRKENPDIVSVCTPSGFHAMHAEKIASYGVHVISEKPMATKWIDGVNMVKACDAAVRLFIVKQNRHNETLQMLKRAIDEKRFGRIHMVHINVFWNRSQAYYDQGKWRGTRELDGGAFMNQASHYVDLLEWLFGSIESVQAMTGTLLRDIEVEDCGVINIRWKSGAMGSMAATMLTYPTNLEGSITVLGENGTAKIGGVAVNEIQSWDFADKKDYDQAIKETSYETASVYGYGHSVYFKNVINVLRGEAEPATDGREGLKSLAVLVAAYLSAYENRTVSLPLEFKDTSQLHLCHNV